MPDSRAAPERESPVLLELRAVSKQFGRTPTAAARLANRFGLATPKPPVQAVGGVSLAIRQGEVVGLVGESGCGKSTLGRIAAGILRPTQGEVFYRGRNIDSFDEEERRRAKLRVQMIFQDPFASLNPRKRVGDSVGEAPWVHGLIERARGSRERYVAEQFLKAGLSPNLMRRYPHQFSGGQRQRIGIARALAVQPEMLVCDEAVAALDVSIRAQIINLFMDLRERLDLTYLFISHDLGVVEHLADRVAIMYLGRVVEEAPTEVVFTHPNHPYTQALLADVPRIDARKRSFAGIRGELPSPMAPPSGCHFHPRCPHAMERCAREVPVLREIAPGHRSACHLNDAPSRIGATLTRAKVAE